MEPSRRGARAAGATLNALVGLAAAALLLAPAGRAAATTFSVPEPFATIDLAIAAADEGDTVALAAGSYLRIPAAFSKGIVLRGLGADPAETSLAGLKAGRARVENLTFQLPPNPAGQTALVEATDSLTIRDCVFRSTTTGLVVNETGVAPNARLRLEQCLFTGLIQAGRVRAPAAADVRITFEDCAFTECAVGLDIGATGVGCTPGDAPAPPVVESDVRATLTRCTFDHTSGTCLNVSNLPGGVLLDDCHFTQNALSLNAALTGVRLRDTVVEGTGGLGRGLVVTSSRLEIVRSTVTGHDIGITVADFPDCRPSSGLLGGNQDDYNRLGGNTTWNLLTTRKLEADYNYWSGLNCAEAQARVSGQGLGIICDAVGRPLTNCATPVAPTTWSGIKAAYGRDAGGAGAPEVPH